MVNSHKPSVSRKGNAFWRGLKHFVLDILRTAWQQVFGSRRSSKPIGYWARDRYGRWELRVPAFGLKEGPPAR